MIYLIDIHYIYFKITYHNNDDGDYYYYIISLFFPMSF